MVENGMDTDGVSKLEKSEYWRVPWLGELEVIHACYRRHAFERHAHEGYATGIIDRGAGSFWYRGATWAVPAGSLTALDAEEAHTGQVISEEGWSYRILYVGPKLLEGIAGEAFGWRGGVHFPEPVFHDEQLSASVDLLHCSLRNPAPALELESLLLSTCALLLARHADRRALEPPVGKEPKVVRRAREYLEEHFAEDISLRDLAETVGLSRFHLIRVFREAVGLPPHAYLTQVRLRRARKLLAAGGSIGVVAREVGFADQSHLTRRFKGFFGITPARFAAGAS